MTLIFVLVGLGLIWVNLTGLGLLARRLTGDYAVARVGGAIVLCLLFFSLEHFHGLGPKLWFFPLSTALSVWMIWHERAILRREWDVEAAFGVGFIYCEAWRYVYPSIDLDGEKVPDLVFINDYMQGTRLPAPDRWLPPYNVDFYYSFQHYSAALLGRWFALEPTICYHFAYCVVSGLIICSGYSAVRRLCAWRPAGWLVTTALLVGGCGLGFTIHLAQKVYNDPGSMVRFVGTGKTPEDLTALGKWAVPRMSRPGADWLSGSDLVELPAAPLSQLIAQGEFHPPLTGFLLMALSLLVMGTLSSGDTGQNRATLFALLAATIPISIAADAWVLPLQLTLVLSWFIYRGLSGETSHWLPGLFGAGASFALCYPFLVNFLQHPAAQGGSIRLVTQQMHAMPLAWLAIFWPLVVLVVLAPLNRERRGLALFFACLLVVLLAGTEMFYIRDTYTGTEVRYNSCLKWWGWVYASGIIGLGALNLGSRNRICRYGSLVAILLPTAQAYDFGRQFMFSSKDQMGMIDGTGWLSSDDTVGGIITTLKGLPPGIAIESSDLYENSDSTLISVFAGKTCYVGWPTQERIWRNFPREIGDRVAEEDRFYAGTMDDPLKWLLTKNIRYVLWLQRDNDHLNERFLPLDRKIKSHYLWRLFAGTGDNWAVGFWERIDPQN